MIIKSVKIFYGWFIIGVSLFTIGFAHSGSNFGFSSFIMPLSQEFGHTRGALSLAQSTSLFSYMIAATITGALIDRYGAKLILLSGTFIYGTILCSMYYLTASIWHLYFMYMLLGLFGTSVSVIPHARLAISWFDKHKGLALALSSSGAGLAGIIIPPYIRWVVDIAGWREAYFYLGCINLLLSLPLVYWVVYNTPEQKGTYPDGVPPQASKNGTHVPITRYGYTFRECMRSPRFWKIAVMFALFATIHAMVSQLVPLLEDAGFSRSAAAYTTSLLGASMIIGRLACGYLVDKFFAPYVTAVFHIMPVIGLAALALEPNLWTGIFGAITLGLAMGAEFDVMPFFCVQYFGRIAFGKIYGIILILFSLGAGSAVYLAGLSYDIFSSYMFALLAVSGLSLVGVGILFTIGPYPQLPKYNSQNT